MKLTKFIAAAAAVTMLKSADIPESGDVNGDGRFTSADLVTLSRYLLSEDDDLADRKAGDLCSDGRLDTYDLLMMRRMLTEKTSADLLRGMDYSSAVSQGLIMRSEYDCQITGDLKRSIEEQLGRPLDYSIDRFYRVTNDPEYLYNSASMEVYPITATTKKTCATWYWKGSKAALYELDDNMEKQSEFLDALEFYGVTEVYYSSGPNSLVKKKDTVAAFVKNAYARDMRVYLLCGDRNYLGEETYESTIFNTFNKVDEYNSLVDYDARIAGVSYDAEVWVEPSNNWKTDAAVRSRHIKYIAEAQRYAEEKNLSVNFCLPYWITRYYYTDDQGVTRNMYDGITSIVNDTILMVYRDTPAAILKLVTQVQSDADNSSLYYAEKNGCNLEIAVEINATDEGAHVSFYEEEKERMGCVRDALAEVDEQLPSGQHSTTFAIHHAVVMYENYLSARESGEQ